MTTNQTIKRFNRGGGDLGYWTKSSKCSAGVCVEARIVGAVAELRDSKENHLGPAQPIISIPLTTFETFQDELTGKVAAGTNGKVVVDRLADGGIAFRSVDDDVVLRYDAQEIEAFVAGVRAGEFRLVVA